MIQFQIEKGIPLPPPRCYEPHQPGACKCGRMPRRGYKTCDTCLAVVKAAYQTRRAQGMCGWGTTCSNMAAEGHSMCNAHLKRSGKRIRELLDGRVAQGLCRRCGKRESAGVKTFCLVCYQTGGGQHGVPSHPIPTSIRKLVRQFWRLDRIDQRREHAEKAVRFLPSRTAEIVSLRHGLIDGIDHTLESVGNKYKVTRERIRQIENKAYKLLTRQGFDCSLLKNPRDIQRPSPKQQPRKLTARQRRKEYARYAVSEAIRAGRLVKQPCERCGKADKVIAHHPDYSKPLEVQWLCSRHHAEAHGKQTHPPKPKYEDAPSWLVKAGEPSNDHYDAPAIVAKLKKHWVKQSQIRDITGLSRKDILAIVKGEPVNDKSLARMLRYVDALAFRQVA